LRMPQAPACTALHTHMCGAWLGPLAQDALLVAEAAQLTRLCDLAEPRVEVLLVLPAPPDEDVLNYWNKILEVCAWACLNTCNACRFGIVLCLMI